MWGTHYLDELHLYVYRFIPTHVGNSLRTSSGLIYPSVHPHACGELWTATARLINGFGSSPRMWGTRNTLFPNITILRFIPTHVGNSARSGARICRTPVHPHACGELTLSHGRQRPLIGSSPRMWGTPCSNCHGAGCARFIPTHVGNSIRIVRHVRILTVHPHACGELPLIRRLFSLADGSSPRMWGTHLLFLSSSSRLRFIPTHVGNSLRSGVSLFSKAVHPHACGELLSRIRTFISRIGSSPRMWGTLPLVPQRSVVIRFIPTHVGNSFCARWKIRNSTVHPHACGELYGYCPHPGYCDGSSPRMWGTLHGNL